MNLKRSCIFALLMLVINITYSQALLKFDKDTVDFGTVKEGDTVKYNFWFTNVGNANLTIKQAWPSCGCTHPSYTQGEIKPGERGVLNVEFRSVGFGGQTVHKNIIIINNGIEKYANFTATIIASSLTPKQEVHNHNHPHPHEQEAKAPVEVKKEMPKKKRKKK